MFLFSHNHNDMQRVWSVSGESGQGKINRFLQEKDQARKKLFRAFFLLSARIPQPI
jgi:hypothetical protein